MAQLAWRGPATAPRPRCPQDARLPPGAQAWLPLQEGLGGPHPRPATQAEPAQRPGGGGTRRGPKEKLEGGRERPGEKGGVRGAGALCASHGSQAGSHCRSPVPSTCPRAAPRPTPPCTAWLGSRPFSSPPGTQVLVCASVSPTPGATGGQGRFDLPLSPLHSGQRPLGTVTPNHKVQLRAKHGADASHTCPPSRSLRRRLFRPLYTNGKRGSGDVRYGHYRVAATSTHLGRSAPCHPQGHPVCGAGPHFTPRTPARLSGLGPGRPPPRVISPSVGPREHRGQSPRLIRNQKGRLAPSCRPRRCLQTLRHTPRAPCGHTRAATRQPTRSRAPPGARCPSHARGPASCPQSAACQASRGAGGRGQAHEAAGGGLAGARPCLPRFISHAVTHAPHSSLLLAQREACDSPRQLSDGTKSLHTPPLLPPRCPPPRPHM